MTGKENDRDSRQRILDAALDVFYEAGFDGARVDAIAKRAGVNQALIYYYFKSKEGLFRELLNFHIQEMISAKKNAIGRKNIYDLNAYDVDLLKKVVDQMMGVLKKKEKVFSIVLGELYRNPSRKNGGEIFDVFLPAIDESRKYLLARDFDSDDLNRTIIAGIFFGSVPMITYATLGQKLADHYGIDKESLDEIFTEFIYRFSEDYVACLKKRAEAGLRKDPP